MNKTQQNICLINFLNRLKKNDKVKILFSNGMYFEGKNKNAKKVLSSRNYSQITDVKRVYSLHSLKKRHIKEYEIYVDGDEHLTF